MKKFLFTDGTIGVIEVQSPEELEARIDEAADPARVRIWLFSSSEWISLSAYRKQFPAPVRKPVATADTPMLYSVPKATRKKRNGIRKLLYLTGGIAGVLLVVNFTAIKWEKAAPVTSTASRPLNMPPMDIDSLISEIEMERGQALDRSTRTNLRLRNSWPDRIGLQLTADRESNGSASRFYNLQVSIDNTTGFNLDKAVVRFIVWKNKQISITDTLQFSNIRYDKLSSRERSGKFRGDSISVAFESIRAKAFNFCYAASTKNNSGNYNDRWFCRD